MIESVEFIQSFCQIQDLINVQQNYFLFMRIKFFKKKD